MRKDGDLGRSFMAGNDMVDFGNDQRINSPARNGLIVLRKRHSVRYAFFYFPFFQSLISCKRVLNLPSNPSSVGK